jgi:hypothetical protein
MELKPEIKDFIESVELTTDKEFTYISQNDWTLISDREVREEEYKLHQLLTKRAITNAVTLYKKAKDDLTHPDVKSALNKFFDFLKVHEQRSDKYLSETDWMADGYSVGEKRFEIEFQSTILKNTTGLKEEARSINYGEESLEVNLPIHGDVPAPLLMRQKLEERYPEIKKYLEDRKSKENVLPLKLELKEEAKYEKPRRKRTRGGRKPGY